MLSWSESKGERACPFIPICVYHVSGGVSSLQRCEILPARLLSPPSALRVFDCSSSCGLMQLQLISLQSFLRTREENQSLSCVFWCSQRVDQTSREANIRDLFFIPPEVMSQFVEVGNLDFAEKDGPLVICCSSQGI
jgi:hypothetical protein